MENVNKELILKSFKTKEERFLFSKIFDQLKINYYQNITTFSDFLNPITTGKYISILKNVHGLNISVFGGFSDAERLIIGFSRSDFLISEKNFPIDTIEISFNNKFVSNLEHRDFLGSILGLGIDRMKIGDIIVFDNKAYVFVTKDISEYIVSNLVKVKNATVKSAISSFDDKVLLANRNEKQITLSSLRVDVLISKTFNLSRSKANNFVSSEKVFVNWETETNTSKIIKENDIITVRGLGRIKLKEILGVTRKDKISAIVIIYG